ncbi:MAG: transcriptional repressor LexA [Thermodesulfobacteriota bacterium]
MLTTKQSAFLDYLKECLDNQGRAPSLRQAALDLGISHSAVAQFIGQLEKKGYLERAGHYSRTIRLLSGSPPEKKSGAGRELPVIGQITAGLPMYAQQEWDGSVWVDAAMFPGDNLFCLRVDGQSMRDAGILDRDFVVCEPRQYAENGEVVVALLHGEEATVKRFFRHDDCIELRPENKEFDAKRYGFGELLVQGKVVGVIRGQM